MARRWTVEEENYYREQLTELYIVQNKTIREVGVVLGIAETTVFDRLQRLGVPSCPKRKIGYCNSTRTVVIPAERSGMLAEFLGIMLGDGHISHFQTIVTLGTKELEYVEYVAELMHQLFQTQATIGIRKNGYRDVYIGSVALTTWLKREGLVGNKVGAQVDVPEWIFERPEWMASFLRGFFDTDGSIYRLKFGRQISFTNRSLPLLYSLRELLIRLEYKPSAVCSDRVYLTRKGDVDRFFNEVRPANRKHLRRYAEMTST